MLQDELSGRKPYEQQIKYNSKGKAKQPQGLNGYKILYGSKQRGSTSMQAESMNAMHAKYNNEYYSRGGGYRQAPPNVYLQGSNSEVEQYTAQYG